jgi:hypothetical protein
MKFTLFLLINRADPSVFPKYQISLPQTILALWKMFEEIIQYLFEKGAIHERNVYDLRTFVAKLEAYFRPITIITNPLS